MAIHLFKIPGKLKAALWGEKWFDISLYLLFLVFFLSPFLDSVPLRMLISSVIFSMLMLAGVLSISGHRVFLFFGGMTACIAITLRWMQHITPSPAIAKTGSLAILIFLIMLNAMALTKVYGTGRVTMHKIKGAIACYILFGMTFSVLYGFLDQVLPNAFNLPLDDGTFTTVRQEMLTYYSFVTLTTIGYGDITPVHEIARMFAVLEGLCGQLYPATLLARLVSLEVSSHGGGNADESKP